MEGRHEQCLKLASRIAGFKRTYTHLRFGMTWAEILPFLRPTPEFCPDSQS